MRAAVFIILTVLSMRVSSEVIIYYACNEARGYGIDGLYIPMENLNKEYAEMLINRLKKDGEYRMFNIELIAPERITCEPFI